MIGLFCCIHCQKTEVDLDYPLELPARSVYLDLLFGYMWCSGCQTKDYKEMIEEYIRYPPFCVKREVSLASWGVYCFVRSLEGKKQ